MLHLTTLPPEILHNIFQWLGLQDLGHLPRTCRQLHGFVGNNKALFREVYLLNLDVPPNAEKIDWIRDVKDAAKLVKICRENDRNPDVPFVCDTALRLLSNASETSPPTNRSLTCRTSLNASFLANCLSSKKAQLRFLCQSSLYHSKYGLHGGAPGRRVLRGSGSSTPMNQQSAKLHCLFGRPVLQSQHPSSPAWSLASPFHAASARVYALDQYTNESLWGPFKADGSGDVDWEKVEAIMVVLATNIEARRRFEVAGLFDGLPFQGCWPGSYVAPDRNHLHKKKAVNEEGPSRSTGCSSDDDGNEREDQKDLDARDPYGVSGTWLRIVSFMDWTDLHNYNFPHAMLPWRGSHQARIFDRQETRLIVMSVKATRLSEPSEEDGNGFPIVHFTGTARSLQDVWDPNAHSEIKGSVRMTKEGEVRWTTFSIFGGESRWRSECIQLGGRRSARGVIGNWFDVDFDRHGPVGPTAFWKVSDEDAENLEFHIHQGPIGAYSDSDSEGDGLDLDLDELDADDLEDTLIEIVGFWGDGNGGSEIDEDDDEYEEVDVEVEVEVDEEEVEVDEEEEDGDGAGEPCFVESEEED